MLSDEDQLTQKRDYQRKRRAEKPEHVNKIRRESYHRRKEDTKEHTSEVRKEWRAANQEKLRLEAKEYAKRKRVEDPEYAARAREAQARWRSKNKDKQAARSKACREANIERYRKISRDGNRERSGIVDHHRVDEVLALQGGVCAICGTSRFGGRGKDSNTPNADHDHKTGLLRGVLCNKHNIMLGMAGDDPNMLLKGVEYLLNPPAQRQIPNPQSIAS